MVLIKINNEKINLPYTEVLVRLQVFFKKPTNSSDVCYGEISDPITANLKIISGGQDVTPENTNQYTINYNENENTNIWLPYETELNSDTEFGDTDLYLEILGVSNCDCNYEVLIKDVNILINKEIPNIIEIEQIGFNNEEIGDEDLEGVVRVIDNKKSWVYNPGRPKYGITEYDNIVRKSGDRGLIFGHGNLNRTFAPSPDADIKYRKTDYLEQSSVEEKHSNFVINSKELFLTFNVKPIESLSGYTLLNIEEYKKTFQSFWVKMVEQFIPASSIFISSEKWSNNPNDICKEVDECDLDLNLSLLDVTATGLDNIITFTNEDTTTPLVFSVEGDSVNVLESNTETTYSSLSNYDTNSDTNLLSFDSLKVITLEEDLNTTNVTTEKLVVEDIDNKKSDMFNYRTRLNKREETTVFV